MARCHRLTVVSAALLTSLSLGASAAYAQSSTTKSDLEVSPDLSEVFERIERQDKQAKEDGMLLEKSQNTHRQDSKLSFGKVDDGSDLPYSLDPTVDPNPPPGFGLNLKMSF